MNINRRLLKIINRIKNTIKRTALYFIENRRIVSIYLFSVALIFLIIYTFSLRAPSRFPEDRAITIDKGSTLSMVAIQLKDERVIRSAFLYKFINYISGNQDEIHYGDYYFHEKKNLFQVGKIMANGEFGLIPIHVTIYEGSTIFDIAKKLDDKFDRFDSQVFLELAENKEGYLFPDTYYLLPNTTAEQVIKIMNDNFFTKIKPIGVQITNFGKSLNDVVIMASILEKEARETKTRKIISGILWDRIEIGMPLQVDAVFPYIIGKNTFQLTLEDLAVDSPYNTYKYKGLPIGPISNPGLDSIIAAITPIETPYLYYLSDLSGKMYYSATFEGHKANKAKYLR